MRIRDAPQRGPWHLRKLLLANMAKPPKPRMPMPTAFAAMKCLIGVRAPFTVRDVVFSLPVAARGRRRLAGPDQADRACKRLG